MKLTMPNAGRYRVMENLRIIQDDSLSKLSVNPTAEEMKTILTVGDARSIRDTKGLQTLADGPTDLVVPGPERLRIHHIATEQYIGRLKELGFSSLDKDDSPAKIFTLTEHFGTGPNSLHNRMYYRFNGDTRIGKTVLHPDRLAEFTDPARMTDAFLAFYDSYPEYADLAKALRGYCSKEGVPLTRHNPSDLIDPPWPWY